jgi:hypothetical protein
MGFFDSLSKVTDIATDFLDTENLFDISSLEGFVGFVDNAASTIYGLLPGGIISDIFKGVLGNTGFIVDTVTGEKMAFQYNTIPSESGGAEYEEQKCLGRSVPQLHYVCGKARTLELPIVFTMEDQTRDDVRKNVRWLESLAYPDYEDDDELSLAPHPVVVVQGKLYSKDLWVVKDFSIKWGEVLDPISQIPSEALINLTLVEVKTTGKSSDEVIRL